MSGRISAGECKGEQQFTLQKLSWFEFEVGRGFPAGDGGELVTIRYRQPVEIYASLK